MNEKEYLRELAKKYVEYASADDMKQKEKLWINHNGFLSRKSPVIMEIDTFMEELLPPLKCTSGYGKELEKYFQYYIRNSEEIRDDKVIPMEVRIPMDIQFKLFNIDLQVEHSKGTESVGYHTVSPIQDLETQVYELEKSTFSYNKEETERYFQFAEETVGDILPVVYENQSLRWALMPTKCVVDLMSMEEMFMAMYDCPDELHLLLRKITDDFIAYCNWQEAEGLLTENMGNYYVGSGSYGFVEPSRRKKPEKLTLKDLWGNMNSQESVGISPEMYEEFFAPYYRELASLFGAVYYGCCEPCNVAWNSIKTYPNLRKVSVSAWADEPFMGKVLAENKLIYSRKPSPNYVGVGEKLDEEAFREYMRQTFEAAKDCQLEIIFRDIYTVGNNLQKPRRAVEIVRELIEEYRG